MSKARADESLETQKRIASALERIADRFDDDHKAFSEMVEAGRNLAVPKEEET